ncbi:MAG TPA: tetratricopeptide repeat protein [Verrucomicrobiae bacterium]|nr:tetratricopeptide repeat protein [Verrucomicrobiae bacterium]
MQSYTRHKLKQDKFRETAEDAAHWAGGHRSTVLWVVGILVVLAGAGVALFAWHARQTEQANLALGKALQTANAQLRPPGTPAPEAPAKSFTSAAERGKAAEKEFKEIADKFPWTETGKIAAYLEGTAAIQAGDDKAAEEQLKTVAADRDKDVASLAKLALANFYRSSNRQADADKIYRDLIDHPSKTVSKEQVQLEMAEMYESTNPQQAAGIYQQIQKDSPKDSVAAQIAASKLKGEK